VTTEPIKHTASECESMRPVYTKDDFLWHCALDGKKCVGTGCGRTQA